MRTAIYLEQHPLLGHPWSAAPVLGWSALPWAGLARPHQNPPYGGTGQPQSLSVGQQFAQVGMVDALIAFLGQGHYSLLDGLWRGVGWCSASVPVDQSLGPFLPIGRQQSPSLAFTYPQDRCRLLH